MYIILLNINLMLFGYIRWFKRCFFVLNILILKLFIFLFLLIFFEIGWFGFEVVFVFFVFFVVEFDIIVGFFVVLLFWYVGFVRIDNFWLVVEFFFFSRIFCIRKIKSVNCIFCYMFEEKNDCVELYLYI